MIIHRIVREDGKIEFHVLDSRTYELIKIFPYRTDACWFIFDHTGKEAS